MLDNSKDYLLIPIKSSKDKIIEQYLTIVNPILGSKKLSSIEIKVLSKLLEVKAMYEGLGEDLCNKLIFHQETKKRVRQVIGEELKSVFSVSSMNNVITSLRKKGIIEKTKLKFNLPIKDSKIQVLFRFEVDDIAKVD
jgi:hypothetical protein